MTRPLLLIFLIIQQLVIGQNLSKQQLINDLTFLNKAVVNGHPVNYNPARKISIQSTIDKAKLITYDSITPWEYTLWIEKGIFNIGCSHTTLRKNPLLLHTQKRSFIPLTATVQNGKLLITSCEDTSKTGQIIEQINSVYAADIIDAYKEYKASDGISTAFSEEYFSLAASKLISNYLKNTDQYLIKTETESFLLNGAKDIYLKKSTEKTTLPLLANNQNRLDSHNHLAILKISSFRKSDKSFFKEIFKTIHDLKMDTLLIDLRQNTGGNIKAAAELTKHLIDSSFSYSTLQPKLKPWKYLNPKGKWYYFLSKLKYNIASVVRIRKTTYGYQYVYSFKPVTKHHFKGTVYVLTDGFTASASTMVTAWLKHYRNITIIGRQAGGGYNGNNGGSFPIITLPDSKITITFPVYRQIINKYSEQDAGILPDSTINSHADMSAIIKLIRNR